MITTSCLCTISLTSGLFTLPKLIIIQQSPMSEYNIVPIACLLADTAHSFSSPVSEHSRGKPEQAKSMQWTVRALCTLSIVLLHVKERNSRNFEPRMDMSTLYHTFVIKLFISCCRSFICCSLATLCSGVC